MTTYWMIETGRQTWWNGRGNTAAYFTDKPQEAIHFARFQDAEVIRCWLLDGLSEMLRATEHMDIEVPR